MVVLSLEINVFFCFFSVKKCRGQMFNVRNEPPIPIASSLWRLRPTEPPRTYADAREFVSQFYYCLFDYHHNRLTVPLCTTNQPT